MFGVLHHNMYSQGGMEKGSKSHETSYTKDLEKTEWNFFVKLEKESMSMAHLYKSACRCFAEWFGSRGGGCVWHLFLLKASRYESSDPGTKTRHVLFIGSANKNCFVLKALRSINI